MTFSNAARIECVQFLGTGQGEGVSMQTPVSLEKPDCDGWTALRQEKNKHHAVRRRRFAANTAEQMCVQESLDDYTKQTCIQRSMDQHTVTMFGKITLE